jgi:hypothetical protein
MDAYKATKSKLKNAIGAILYSAATLGYTKNPIPKEWSQQSTSSFYDNDEESTIFEKLPIEIFEFYNAKPVYNGIISELEKKTTSEDNPTRIYAMEETASCLLSIDDRNDSVIRW